MSPRTEFIAVSALLACVLATLGTLWFFRAGSDVSPGRSLALVAGTAGALTGAAAAVVSSIWQARARRAGTAWSAEGFSLRTTAPALLLFPILLGLAAGLGNLLTMPSATPLSDASYVMMILFAVGIFASAAGALPFAFLEFLVCHRYLRRTTVTTGSA